MRGGQDESGLNLEINVSTTTTVLVGSAIPEEYREALEALAALAEARDDSPVNLLAEAVTGAKHAAATTGVIIGKTTHHHRLGEFLAFATSLGQAKTANQVNISWHHTVRTTAILEQPCDDNVPSCTVNLLTLNSPADGMYRFPSSTCTSQTALSPCSYPLTSMLGSSQTARRVLSFSRSMERSSRSPIPRFVTCC